MAGGARRKRVSQLLVGQGACHFWPFLRSEYGVVAGPDVLQAERPGDLAVRSVDGAAGCFTAGILDDGGARAC